MTAWRGRCCPSAARRREAQRHSWITRRHSQVARSRWTWPSCRGSRADPGARRPLAPRMAHCETTERNIVLRRPTFVYQERKNIPLPFYTIATTRTPVQKTETSHVVKAGRVVGESGTGRASFLLPGLRRGAAGCS